MDRQTNLKYEVDHMIPMSDAEVCPGGCYIRYHKVMYSKDKNTTVMSPTSYIVAMPYSHELRNKFRWFDIDGGVS